MHEMIGLALGNAISILAGLHANASLARFFAGESGFCDLDPVRRSRNGSSCSLRQKRQHGRRFSCVPIGRYPYRWLTYYLGGAERGGPFSVCVADGVAAGKPTECFNPNAAMICAEALSRKEVM